MATSGVMRPSSNGILATWSLAGQNVAGNYSVVNVAVGWSFQSSPTDRQLDNGRLDVNGTTVWDVPGRVHNYVGGQGAHDFYAWSGQRTIAHDGSGNATINMYAEMTGYTNTFSSDFQFWDLPQIPRLPSAPGTPTVTGHTDSDPTTATLSWTAPSDVGAGLDDRRVVVSTSPSASDVSALVFDNVADWSTSVGATGLPKGTTLYTKVAASSIAGYGPYSGVLQFTTGTTVPSVPGTPTFPTVGGSSVTVSWTPSSDSGGTPITSYDVQRATNSGFSSGVVNASVPAGSNTLSVSGLAHTTTYYYRVRAVNATGNSSYSAGASFTTATTPPTPPATGPTIVTRTPVSVTISYTAPSDNGGTAITGYTIQWATEPTFASPGTLTEATTSRSITALLPSTAYFVRVRANNAVGSSAWSSTLSTRTTSGLKVGGVSSWTEADMWVSSPDGMSWLPARLWTSDGSTWK